MFMGWGGGGVIHYFSFLPFWLKGKAVILGDLIMILVSVWSDDAAFRQFLPLKWVKNVFIPLMRREGHPIFRSCSKLKCIVDILYQLYRKHLNRFVQIWGSHGSFWAFIRQPNCLSKMKQQPVGPHYCCSQYPLCTMFIIYSRLLPGTDEARRPCT